MEKGVERQANDSPVDLVEQCAAPGTVSVLESRRTQRHLGKTSIPGRPGGWYSPGSRKTHGIERFYTGLCRTLKIPCMPPLYSRGITSVDKTENHSHTDRYQHPHSATIFRKYRWGSGPARGTRLSRLLRVTVTQTRRIL